MNRSRGKGNTSILEKRHVLICILSLLLTIVAGNTCHAEKSGKRILVINSYNQRMPWVADIMRGVEDVLVPERNNYSLYIENMDSKEFHSPEYFQVFKKHLQVKYQNTSLDLIFSSDNNAYDFLLQNRDQLFPGVPVIFCGVNNFEEKQLADLNGFTGVAEIFSARKTIELALKLQPDISKVYVINDYLKTGRLWAETIDNELKPLQHETGLSIEYSENLSKAELLAKVGSFGQDTVILLGAYFSDKNMEAVRYEQIAGLLSKASSVPIYCLVGFVIDEGLMGGHVISGYYQGYSMGQIGLNVLIGVSPEIIPVMLRGSNKPIVNHEQLVRFRVNPSELSSSVEIVRKPYSFYDEYEREIWITLSLIICLVTAVFALVLNTGRLRRAQAALGKNEKQLRQLANATWEAIVIHDDGVLLQSNELFTEMFGFKPEELQGRNFLSYIYSEQSYQKAHSRIQKGLLGPYEAVGRRKDNTTFPIEVRVRSMIYKEGDVRVVAIRDLSERKSMEEQLAQSQKIEAIGTLAGGIAHDFNNILSAIIGYSEIAMFNLSNVAMTRKSFEGILQAGHRAKNLTQQILTFAHKSEQNKEPVQVSHVAREAIKLLRASMPTSIEIQTDINTDSYTLGDATKIHQIVMNLSTNARKAMPEGGILAISLKNIEMRKSHLNRHQDAASSAYIQLNVQDNGVGMPDQVMSRIFDPFFTTRDKSDGTGLGLSVVHGIVTEIGGFITVDSMPDRGTIFDVYFPLADSQVKDEPRKMDKLPLGNETIMLVDDEAMLIEVGSQALESLGYTVHGFSDSLQALEFFDKYPDKLDLVITDMTMPKMAGDKLASRLLTKRPNIPIVVYTGYSENLTEMEAVRMGIKRFLFKPIDTEIIAKTVREVLDMAKS